MKRVGEDELQPAGNATNLDKLWKFVEFKIHLWSIDSVCVCATIRSQCVRASKRFTREEERRRGEKSFRLDMEDVGLWQAYEAQALMYNAAPDNHQTASVADSPACTPQQSSFLPCWNESWLHAPRGPHEEIHDVSTLVSTPSLLVDTVSFEQRHNQQFIQAVSSSSSSSPELLQNIVVPCTGSDGLWQLPHHSTSGGSSLLASELYSCSSVGDDHSELHKSTTQVRHFSNMSMARTSNSDFQSGYNNDKLLIQPATPGAASAAAAAGGGAMMMSTRTHQFSRGTVPQMHATTAGGSVRRDSCLDELLQNPHKLYQLPVVVPEKIQMAAIMDPRFSPRGNGAAAATMNAQQENLPRQTGVAAAGGMKSMASFNPGPYVSSSRSAAAPAPAVGERQEHGILAAHKTWFENKPGNNTTAPNNGFDQLGGSSAQRIVASQQQQQQQQQMVVRPQSLVNEWPSRRMMSSIPAVPLPAPWLKPVVDERTSSIVIMQPEAAEGTTTALKCALQSCPSPAAAAASSGSTVAFINSRKRSILVRFLSSLSSFFMKVVFLSLSPDGVRSVSAVACHVFTKAMLFQEASFRLPLIKKHHHHLLLLLLHKANALSACNILLIKRQSSSSS